MTDLQAVFGSLREADQQGYFVEELYRSPLGRQRVHRHPLGFKVVRIAVGAVSLRLHLWQPGCGTEQPGFEVHDHTFDLLSYVVRGRIRQTSFTLTKDPEGDHAMFSVVYGENGSRVVKTNNFVRLVPGPVEEFGVGDLYSVEAGQLHRVDLVSSESGVTLVLTTERGGAPTTVGPRSGLEELLASREELSSKTLAELGLASAIRL